MRSKDVQQLDSWMHIWLGRQLLKAQLQHIWIKLAHHYILVQAECLQCHLVFSDICATSKITDLDEHETQIPTGTFACIIYSVFLLAEAAKCFPSGCILGPPSSWEQVRSPYVLCVLHSTADVIILALKKYNNQCLLVVTTQYFWKLHKLPIVRIRESRKGTDWCVYVKFSTVTIYTRCTTRKNRSEMQDSSCGNKVVMAIFRAGIFFLQSLCFYV